MPQRGAFRTGWTVPTPRIAARVAESHGDYRELLRVVELFGRHVQPLAQPDPTRVVPRNTRFVYPRARGLTDDQHSGITVGPEYGTGPQRQFGMTMGAAAHLQQECIERRL